MDFESLINIGSGAISFLFLLGLGFFIGKMQENRHYRSIRAREEELRDIILVPVRRPPEGGQPYRTDFVIGGVVVAMDYFKRVAGTIKQIFGGQINSYETLLERARREAVLRMKEEARSKNAQMVFNVKFTTANIIIKDNKKAGSVEVVAYGTAIIYQP